MKVYPLICKPYYGRLKIVLSNNEMNSYLLQFLSTERNSIKLSCQVFITGNYGDNYISAWLYHCFSRNPH